MSAGKTYKNPGRALPPIPISSANSSPNKNKNLQISQKAESLASIIPKEPSPPSARPQLHQQESSDKVELEATGNPESQPHTPQHPPQPTTRDLPASPTKFQRRVTASGKRPVLLMPSIKSPRLTVQESPRFSPTFSLSPRTLTPVSENSPVNYSQQFDDLAAELADILDSETKTSERTTKKQFGTQYPEQEAGEIEQPLNFLGRPRDLRPRSIGTPQPGKDVRSARKIAERQPCEAIAHGTSAPTSEGPSFKNSRSRRSGRHRPWV